MTDQDESGINSSFSCGLKALVTLLCKPAEALEVLFTPDIPRLIIPLSILYLVVPIWGSVSLWPESVPGTFFLFLNRELNVGLEDYIELSDFLRQYGLIVLVLSLNTN